MSFIDNIKVKKIIENIKQEREYTLKHSLYVPKENSTNLIVKEILGKVIGSVIGTVLGLFILYEIFIHFIF